MSTHLFVHKYINNNAPKTLVVLHGTGGDETDFMFLDQVLLHHYNLFLLRGNIKENGMNRFFKRNQDGSFDLENIKQEAEKLEIFITEWVDEHSLSIKDLVFLGYSNGANMLLASLFYYPEHFKNLILLHSMLPFTPEKKLNLSDHNAFVTYGVTDEMISPDKTKKVIKTLKSLKAEVIEKEYPTGHQIMQQELQDIIDYVNSRK